MNKYLRDYVPEVLERVRQTYPQYQGLTEEMVYGTLMHFWRVLSNKLLLLNTVAIKGYITIFIIKKNKRLV